MVLLLRPLFAFFLLSLLSFFLNYSPCRHYPQTGRSSHSQALLVIIILAGQLINRLLFSAAAGRSVAQEGSLALVLAQFLMHSLVLRFRFRANQTQQTPRVLPRTRSSTSSECELDKPVSAIQEVAEEE